MKTPCLITAALTLCLAQCSSVKLSTHIGIGADSREIYETGDGKVIRRDGSYVDNLRGAHIGRDDEQMTFARELILKAGSTASDEYNTPYTGRVKVYVWEGRDGKRKFSSLREIQWKDGRRAWQGQNPATNFYGAREMAEFIITDTSADSLNMLRAAGVDL